MHHLNSIKSMAPLAQRWGGWIVLGLLAALGTGCASDKAVLQQANQFNSGLKPAEITDPRVNDYLQQIGRRVQAAAKEADAQGFGPKSHKSGDNSWMFTNQVQFVLVNSKTLNAFTTGGDYVYIYNELLQKCKDENDLAAVVSHEFGHIYCRHVQQGMNRQMALLLGAGAVGAAGYAFGGSDNGAQYAQTGAGLAAAAGQFINMGFTREDEAQADETGFHFYVHAGWDPQQFADFFKTMISLGYDTSSALTSDHPTLASRVEAAQKRVQKLGPNAAALRRPPILQPAEFQQIKQRAQAAGANTPTDQQIANAKQLLQALPRSCWVPNPPPDEIEAQKQLEQKAKQAEKPKK